MRLNTPTDEMLERIVDAHANGKADGVLLLDIHQHNACNHTLSGVIKAHGETYGFIVHNGDWGGTEVVAFGDPEDVGIYDATDPTFYAFVPNAPLPAHLFKVYRAWREQNWFREKERAYNYDKHFAPGGKTEKHYRDWCAAKGLKIGTAQDVKELKPFQKDEVFDQLVTALNP